MAIGHFIFLEPYHNAPDNKNHGTSEPHGTRQETKAKPEMAHQVYHTNKQELQASNRRAEM